MDQSLPQLKPALERARAAHSPLVFATLVATHGSTYRKAGAQIAVETDGRYTGLLSGGCLEGDLVEHARTVFHTGAAKALHYVSGDDDDALFGLGSGCEGSMDIWLTRHDPEYSWYPLPAWFDAVDRGESLNWALVMQSLDPTLPPGTFVLQADHPTCDVGYHLPGAIQSWLASRMAEVAETVHAEVGRNLELGIEAFVASTVLPRRLIILGAGPDAVPIAEIAAALGWYVCIHDHRPAYATREHFPHAASITHSSAPSVSGVLLLSRFDAAVVMSHHLASDLEYLRALAPEAIPYVGLLGPASRRQRLLEGIGEPVVRLLGPRLHAPVGLDLGGREPASIALSIVAEIQAHFHGRGARNVDWSSAGGR